MPQQSLNTGTVANDGTGDPLRDGALKIEANFDELYADKATQDGQISALTSDLADAVADIGANASAIADHETRIDALELAGGGGGLPTGGTTGQVLTKNSATNGDASWQTPSGGGGALGSSRTVGSWTRWRLNRMTPTNGSGNVAATELSMRATVGGANMTTSAQSASSSFSGSQGPDKLVDNDNGTNWANSGNSTDNYNTWVEYQFASATPVLEIRLRAGSTPSQAPREFELLVSADGLTYHKVGLFRFANAWTTSGQEQTISIPATI